eukprot:5247346-Pyramimonas_sp.AAC.1
MEPLRRMRRSGSIRLQEQVCPPTESLGNNARARPEPPRAGPGVSWPSETTHSSTRRGLDSLG